MMRRKESEVVGSLFWMAIGIFFAVGGVKLNVGTLRNPGPGFLPVIMALVLIFFSLFTLVKGLIISSVRPVSGFPWKRPALMIASVFFYGLLLELVGFLLSTFITMFILFGLLRGKSSWTMVFIYAAITALAGWLVFSVALNIPFPSPRLITIWR
jgi:hypothetical protein